VINGNESLINQFQKKEKVVPPLSFRIKQVFFAGLIGVNPFFGDSILENNGLHNSIKNEVPSAVLEYDVTHNETEKTKQAKEVLNDVNQIHLQHDEDEYLGEFNDVLGQHLHWNEEGVNYCGPATLLNLLDTFSKIKNGTNSGLTIVDFMNEYLLDDGAISMAYEDQGLIINRNGTMSPRAIYGLSEQIASEYNYDLRFLYGNENFIKNPPIKKEDLRSFVEENQGFFDQGGVAIMLLSRNLAWEGEVNEEANPHVKVPGFYHYVLVTDMMINLDDSVSFLIADSLGVDGSGFLGYVRMDNNSYTIPSSDYSDRIYTGIDKIFLLTLNN
jgi:hypothetical protein